MSEEIVNASNPRTVKKGEDREKRQIREREDDLREILATAAGRRFLRRLIFVECRVHETSYHSSGQLFAAQEGRRGVGAQLQGEIMNASLEGWLTLEREQFSAPDA
jgi:hypothetical protein